MRAIGATPCQTAATLVVSQLGACALAIGVGIPLGLGLWRLIAGGDLPASRCRGRRCSPSWRRSPWRSPGSSASPPAGSPGVPSPHSSLTNEAMHGASDCWCYCRGHRHCLPAASHQVPSAPASRPRPMATSWSPANSLTLPEVFSVRAGTGRRAASCGDGVARRPTRRPIRVAVESKGAILVADVVHNLRRPCGNPVNKRGCVSEGSWPARTRPPLAFAAASALQRNPLPLTIHSDGAVPALWRRPASGGLRWQAAQRQAERLGGPGIPGAPARERDASDPGQGTSYKAGRLSGTLSGVSRNPPGCRCHPGLAVAASTTPPATAGRCFGVVS